MEIVPYDTDFGRLFAVVAIVGTSHEVIVVEDDASVARLVSFTLRRDGYAVHEAGSLDSGRVLLEAGTWDIVVLDRKLPDGDGIELCREVRAANPHAYILILTGESSAAAKLAGFGCGADDYVTKPFALDELLARVRAGARIVDLQKALMASNRRLEELSNTDPLTGISDRRSFDRELLARFEHSRRYNRPMSTVMIDIDLFKTINDTYGHPIGDSVLRCLAKILDRATRRSDVAARLGGEEFCVLLPETPLFEGLQFAEKIRATFASTEHPGGPEGPQRVTLSAGVAAIPNPRISDAAALIEAADQALYRAKKNGRNRVECERRTVMREVSLEQRVRAQ
jgi:two-component system cell cycle response regulator